jgi:hypothetical protein
MIIPIILGGLLLALAGYGGYVLFGEGEVVRVEAPKVVVEHDKDEASITVKKPKITVEK